VNRGTYICTGTAIDTFHVLTAAHCVDINNDGNIDKKDGLRSITFHLNLDTDAGTDAVDVSIAAVSWDIHPDYTGFNRPSVNDDVAVITLGGSGVPASVPTYSVSTSAITAGTRLYMVGYGRSGDGVTGYTTNASFTIKRTGQNMADAFYGQDDAGRSAANEVFRYDFDSATGNGSMGGPTLGNAIETTLGGGDSGGPSFALCSGCNAGLASSYTIVGVNTFTQGANAPKFGSLGGGTNVGPYSSWILGPHGASGSTGSAGGGNGGNGPPPGNAIEKEENAIVVPPSEPVVQVVTVSVPTGGYEAAPAAHSSEEALISTDLNQSVNDGSDAVAGITASPPSQESNDSTDELLDWIDAILPDVLPC
jgi:hypothetical protein